jgi:hypothetical protein
MLDPARSPDPICRSEQWRIVQCVRAGRMFGSVASLQRTWVSDGPAFSWPTRARTYGRLCYGPGVAGIARCAGGA